MTVGYADGSNSQSITFTAGDTRHFFCVPTGTPASNYVVLSVVCAGCQANPLLFNSWSNATITQKIYNGTAVVSTTSLIAPTNAYFSGMLTINPGNGYTVASALHNYSGNWQIGGNCQFQLTANNIIYTLYSVSSSALSIGQRNGNIEEIWNFTAAGSPCSSPTTLQASSIQSSNNFISGAYPSRHILTLIAGTADNQPAYTCTTSDGGVQNGTSIATFYSCLVIQILWWFDCQFPKRHGYSTANMIPALPLVRQVIW